MIRRQIIMKDFINDHASSRVTKRLRLLSLILAALMIPALLLQTASYEACAASDPGLNAKVLHMHTGDSFRLRTKGAKAVKWKTSDAEIASVSKGRVKARKPGTATITAVSGKKKYRCSVTVAGSSKRALIVYFAATGKTKKTAEKLRKAVGADMVRLVPVNGYTKNDLKYSRNSRAGREQSKNAFVATATAVTDISKYDTIYLGYPIWWEKEPGVIRSFLRNNSLRGKTVIPFCTSDGDGISGSMKNIRRLAKGAEVKNGKDITGSTVGEMRQWAESLQAQ